MISVIITSYPQVPLRINGNEKYVCETAERHLRRIGGRQTEITYTCTDPIALDRISAYLYGVRDELRFEPQLQRAFADIYDEVRR